MEYLFWLNYASSSFSVQSKKKKKKKRRKANTRVYKFRRVILSIVMQQKQTDLTSR